MMLIYHEALKKKLKGYVKNNYYKNLTLTANIAAEKQTLMLGLT